MSPRRIARALRVEDLLVGRRWATKIFIVVDIICLGTQIAGSILSGSEDMNEARNGRATILAGLVLQIVAFGLFVMCVMTFQMRIRSTVCPETEKKIRSTHKYLHGLYGIGLAFVVRNTVRIVEFQQGPDSELLSNEIWLYVMDATLMLIIVVVMLVWHPGRLSWRVRREQRYKGTEVTEDYIALT